MTQIAAETRIRISLDAQADMHAIDRADEADDFAGAWLGAITGLAEALGLADCEGFRAPAGSPAEADGCTVTEIAGDESTVEAVLWQAAHDLCERNADAAAGDRWQWSEPSAQTVGRLRRRLRLAAGVRAAIEAEGEADGAEAVADAVRDANYAARAAERKENGAAEVAAYEPGGWVDAARNAGAHAFADSLQGSDNEDARRAYYAAYDRGARAAQKALSAE